MKIGWGKRILFLYLGFVALIITLVVMSVRQKIDLVTPDYYKQELAYEKKIEGMRNVNALSAKVTINATNEGITLQLPTEALGGTNGNIHFFRPSDDKMDIKDTLIMDTTGFFFDRGSFGSGKYIVYVSWEKGDKEFFSEQTIMVP